MKRRHDATTLTIPSQTASIAMVFSYEPYSVHGIGFHTPHAAAPSHFRPSTCQRGLRVFSWA